MLCCPFRPPFSASNRFPGGTRKFSRRTAASNICNLWRAFCWILPGSFLENCCCHIFSVSSHLKLTINCDYSTSADISVKSLISSYGRRRCHLELEDFPDWNLRPKLFLAWTGAASVSFGCFEEKRRAINPAVKFDAH